MPTGWNIRGLSQQASHDPPLVIGVIDATNNISELPTARYLDWLDGQIRDMRSDRVDMIELNFHPSDQQRREACEKVASAIIRTSFGINTLPISVRTNSSIILNAAIRYAVTMAFTTVECLSGCIDFSAESNGDLNVVLQSCPTSGASGATREILPERFEHIVHEFFRQRESLVELGVGKDRVGLGIVDGFASGRRDYVTLLPSHDQLRAAKFPILFNAEATHLTNDTIGHSDRIHGENVAAAVSLFAIAHFAGIGCVRTRYPKELVAARDMLSMHALSEDPRGERLG